MNCPRCKIELVTMRSGGVEIEECAACGGAFFDEEELRTAKDESDPDLSWMDFEIWNHAERFTVSDTPIGCPRCGASMSAVRYDTTSIEVDYCLSCQGVWLDSGELEKIVEELEGELLRKDFPDYVAASLREAKQVLAGPESLASEWQDLVTVLRMLGYRVLSANPRVAQALTAFQKSNPFG